MHKPCSTPGNSADTQGDAQGAAAQAAAAFEAALTASQKEPAELGILEEIAAAVVAHGRAADAMASLDTVRGQPGSHLCLATLLAARHAGGDSAVTDTMIDDELAAAEAETPSSALRLRRLERRARKVSHAERADLIGELETLSRTTAGEELAAVDRARLHFLRASLCEDDPGSRARAEDAYRMGHTLQPGPPAAPGACATRPETLRA